MKGIRPASGLRPLPEDRRDASLGGIFGQVDIAEVPSGDFVVAMPLRIKDQGQSDFCTAFAVTEISEDQEEIELSPHFQFALICMLRNDIGEWGSDLRSAFASAVSGKGGSLEEALVPEAMRRKIDEGDRDHVADWRNWPEECFRLAGYRAKGSYFKVDGRYDIFDNIRAAMWQFRAEKRTIGVGAMWKDSWTRDEDGIIRESDDRGSFGHAFKIFGQKVINGELHLCAQLSNGPVGDDGIYYFPRAVANREFAPFGQFMFQDMPKETAKAYQAAGIAVSDTAVSRAWKRIRSLFNTKTK